MPQLDCGAARRVNNNWDRIKRGAILSDSITISIYSECITMNELIQKRITGGGDIKKKIFSQYLGLYIFIYQNKLRNTFSLFELWTILFYLFKVNKIR